MSDAERARRYRARRGATTRMGLRPCGTVAAARRHQRRGEPLDGACVEAVAAYQWAMRANRRAVSQPNPNPGPECGDPAPVAPAPAVAAEAVTVSPPAPPRSRPARGGGSVGWVTELVGPGGVVVVWSAHGTEVGARRMVASLARPWAVQGYGVRSRWSWRAAPAGGRQPRWSGRAAALVAAGRIAWDTPPPDFEGQRITSRVVQIGTRRPEVEILIEPAGRSIGSIAGLQAETWQPVDAAGHPSHVPYLQLIVAFLFSRRADGLPAVPADQSDALAAIVTEHGGPPGTNWTTPADTLRAALAGELLDLHHLAATPVEVAAI